MPAGRPPKFKQSFCELILSREFNGLFNVQIANKLGIVEETLYAWARENVEFSEALSRARQNCIDKFLKIGAENVVIEREFVKLNEKTLAMLLAVSGSQKKLSKLADIEDEFEALKIIQRAVATNEIDERFAETATKVVLAKLQVKKDIEMFNDIKLIKEKLGLE